MSEETNAVSKQPTAQTTAALIHLEYYLDHYLAENFDQKIEEVMKEVKERRLRAEQIHQNMFVGASPMAQAVSFVATKGIPDYNITNEDIISLCEERLFNDQGVEKDLQIIAANYDAILSEQFGPEKLNELDNNSDLNRYALEYVANRCREHVIDKLVEKNMPRSSVEYIIEKVFQNSFFGTIAGHFNPSMKEDVVSATMEDRYDPNALETIASWIGAIALDSKTLFRFLPYKKMSTFGIDLAVGMLEDNPEVVKVSQLSQAYFNNEELLGICRKAARNSKNVSNNVISNLNNTLEHPIVLEPSGVSEQSSSYLLKEIDNNGLKAYKILCDTFETAKISCDKSKIVSAEILSNSEERCCHLSAYYLSYVDEMHQGDIKEMKINGKVHSYQEVCQLAYDYSRAARLQALNNGRKEEESVSSEKKNKNVDKDTNSVQQAQPGASPQQTPPVPTTSNGDVSGWQSLLDTFGFGSLGKNFKNMGYMISVLPDMIVNMFTGRSKNFKFSDNIFPISLIFASMFIKSKPLKLLLLGFGAAKLFNNASHAALNKPSQPFTAIQVRKYSDEQLDARLKYVAIKGNTMHAEIDGVPCIIKINDEVMNAYTQGRLPLNTLANAVLRQYDEQTASMSRNYDEAVNASEDKERAIVVK